MTGERSRRIVDLSGKAVRFTDVFKHLVVPSATLLTAVGAFCLAALVSGCAGKSGANTAGGFVPQERSDDSAYNAIVAGLNGYLFVVGGAGIQRFSIANGIPGKTSVTYAGVYAPIAVDPIAHVFYATNGLTITSFASGTTIPLRKLQVVPPPYTNAQNLTLTSLAVDAQHRLYVGYAWAGVCRVMCGPTVALRGVLVYAPGASGSPNFIQDFFVGVCTGYCPVYSKGSVVLAADSVGELIVLAHGKISGGPAVQCNGVCVYTSPLSNPHLTQTIPQPANGVPVGLAVDASNNLYVDNASSSSSFVSAWRRSSSGKWLINHEISIAGAQSFGSGIAPAAGRLFVPDPAKNAVYDVSSLVSGEQIPVPSLTLSVSSPSGVRFDP